MSQPKLIVTADFTAEFNDIVKRFRKDDILVGIPEEDTSRKLEPGDDEKGPVNNATLLAINDLGLPAAHIPPRPAMEIGIKNAQDEIAEGFKATAIAALSQGVSAISPGYNRIGITASVAIKKAINAQNGFPPLSKATLAARKAAGFKGTKALIVSGQMRNAITYVIRGEK